MTIVSDFPLLVGNALGLTGTDASTVGGLLLTVAIMVATALAIGAVGKGKVNPFVIMVILLGEIGLLTVIEWVSYWLLLLAGLMIVFSFASKASKTLG
jgi:hypothetical protein